MRNGSFLMGLMLVVACGGGSEERDESTVPTQDPVVRPRPEPVQMAEPEPEPEPPPPPPGIAVEAVAEDDSQWDTCRVVDNDGQVSLTCSGEEAECAQIATGDITDSDGDETLLGCKREDAACTGRSVEVAVVVAAGELIWAAGAGPDGCNDVTFERGRRGAPGRVRVRRRGREGAYDVRYEWRDGTMLPAE